MLTEALEAKWQDMGRQAEIDAFYPFTAEPDAECEYCQEDGSVCDDCRQSQEEAEVARIIDEREGIDIHSDGFRSGRLAVNVKLYAPAQNYERSLPDDSSRLAYDLASEAERSIAWEMTGERWWEDAKEMAEAYGLESKKIWSEGRSGGWLVYDREPESLSLPELRTFAAFSAAIKRTLDTAVAEVAYQTVFYVRQNLESLKEEIQALGESWAEDRERVPAEELTEALAEVIDRYLGEEE